MKNFNSNNSKIIITGSTGFLGSNLYHHFKKENDVIGVSRKNSDINCDITNSIEISKIITDFNPDFIMHTAGLKDLDYCEKNPEEAYRNNVLGTKNIVDVASKKKTKVIFISSIAVYPNRPGPHIENITGPVNIYGKTKLESEKLIKTLANYINIRTVFWIF